MEVKGVYLNQPWKHEYYNTTSTEFKRMAAEKAYQLFSLLQLHDDGDNILGMWALRFMIRPNICIK